MAARSEYSHLRGVQRAIGSVTMLIPSSILLYLMPFYPLEIGILLIVTISIVSFFYPRGGIAILGVASILPLLNNFGIAGLLIWFLLNMGIVSGASIGATLPFLLFTPYYWATLPGLIGRAKSGLRNVLFFYMIYPLSLAIMFVSASSNISLNTFQGAFKGAPLPVLSSSTLSTFLHNLSLNFSSFAQISPMLTSTTFYAYVVDSAISFGIAGYIITLASRRQRSNSHLKNHILLSAVGALASAVGYLFFVEFAIYLFPVLGASFTPVYTPLIYAAAAGFILSLLSRIKVPEENVPVVNQPGVDQRTQDIGREVKVETVRPDVKWDSIFDMRGTKEKLMAVAEEITEEKKAYGVLLFGPPGTGKTMISKALASKLNWRFVEFNVADILSPWYGMAEKNLDSFFQKVQLVSPVVVFMDEIEGLMLGRSSQEMQESTRRLVNIFLTRIQDFHNRKIQVCFIGATNLPEEIDEALLRPGRFDEVVYVPLPDREGRMEIWKGYIGAEGMDYGKLADKSQRFTPADISNLVQKVARDAKKAGKKP
ncbi:MAG: ATP-binding protein, partial [Thermoplasmataceae archaeon]